MITLSDILDRAAAKLATDAPLLAWCQAQFGKAPVIFIGLDEQNPPGVPDCPCIVLRPAHAADGDEAEEFAYTFRADWAVANDAKTTAAGVTKYSGIAQADALGTLVYDCLRGISDNVAISDRETFYDDGSMFPMWLAGAFFSMRAPHLLGGEVEL